MGEATQLRELFEQALALPAAARAGYLAMHCPDPAQRAAIERMLAADADASDLLDAGDAAAAAVRIGDSELAPALPPGSHIGPFVLVEVLGEGGSSTVFRAFREVDGVRQEVALKLLRHGLYSPDAQRQFRREQRALTALKHPGIARLIEGGIADGGLAYIALELVEGQPITDYAAAHGLELDPRLALFVQVCLAVQAAHRALIVHRDLKPSNVLVTADGEVKLLDFGIAKLLEDDDPTQTVQAAFTPAYAAPEQRAGAPASTATDVYALGVLLGELVTGQRLNDGSGRTPSARVAAAGATPATPRIDHRQLKGDLDAIVMKAIDPEPDRRYASAGALADDIDRLRNKQPVQAHPPSRGYRMRKFVKRHRGGVAVTATFLLAIFSALGVALWQAGVARQQALLANATRDFMTDLFQSASADLPRDQRPSPQQLLQDAASRALGDKALAAPMRAQLLSTLGSVALNNGNYAVAENLFDHAIRLQRELAVDETSKAWIGLLVQKGNLLQRTNRNDQADALMRSIQPTLLGQDSEAAVSGLMLLSATRLYTGHADAAVNIARIAADKADRVFGADSINAIETLSFLGQLCEGAYRYRQSESLLDTVVLRWRKLGLPQDVTFARTLLHLANAKHKLGKQKAADSLFRESIGLMRRIFDKPHDRLAMALGAYAQFLTSQDRFDAAQAALIEALSIDRQVLGADNAKVAALLDAQAVLDHARHHDVAAKAKSMQATRLFAEHAQSAGYAPEYTLARLHLADILIDLGELSSATETLASARHDATTQFDADSPEIVAGIAIEANLALRRGRPAQALMAVDRGTGMLSQGDPSVDPVHIKLLRLRARALLGMGRTPQAMVAIDKALALLQESNPRAVAQKTSLLAQRARLLLASGRPDVATAAIAQARNLNVAADDLSREDAVTLAEK